MGKMVRGFLGREAVGCSPRRLRFAPYLLTGKLAALCHQFCQSGAFVAPDTIK